MMKGLDCPAGRPRSGLFPIQPQEISMSSLRPALVVALALVSGTAVAQTVIVEPPMLPEEAVVVVPPAPMVMGPLDEQGAAQIAMMNGVVMIDEVDRRFWDGNFEVEGTDGAGEDIEVVIDSETGAILDIDD
jgi:hypothetical protein